MSNAEVLTRAADRIERDGLNKGGYYEGYGSGEGVITRDQAEEIRREGKTPAVDIFGALHLETEDDRETSNALTFVLAALGLPNDVFFGPGLLVQWTDEEERTATEVVEVLRKAAEMAAA